MLTLNEFFSENCWAARNLSQLATLKATNWLEFFKSCRIDDDCNECWVRENFCSENSILDQRVTFCHENGRTETIRSAVETAFTPITELIFVIKFIKFLSKMNSKPSQNDKTKLEQLPNFPFHNPPIRSRQLSWLFLPIKLQPQFSLLSPPHHNTSPPHRVHLVKLFRGFLPLNLLERLHKRG